MLDATSALVTARVRDLQAQADRSRLARLAACCRPGAVRAAAVRASTAVGAFFRHGSLSGGARPCCPWPV